MIDESAQIRKAMALGSFPRPRSGPRRTGRCPDPGRDQSPDAPGAAQTQRQSLPQRAPSLTGFSYEISIFFLGWNCSYMVIQVTV